MIKNLFQEGGNFVQKTNLLLIFLVYNFMIDFYLVGMLIMFVHACENSLFVHVSKRISRQELIFLH